MLLGNTEKFFLETSPFSAVFLNVLSFCLDKRMKWESDLNKIHGNEARIKTRATFQLK